MGKDWSQKSTMSTTLRWAKNLTSNDICIIHFTLFKVEPITFKWDLRDARSQTYSCTLSNKQWKHVVYFWYDAIWDQTYDLLLMKTWGKIALTKPPLLFHYFKAFFKSCLTMWMMQPSSFSSTLMSDIPCWKPN